jgi:hypothetical protein
MWTGLNASFCILTSGIRPMGAREVEAFLTHLAVQGKVAVATQNQAKVPKRLPVVLTQARRDQPAG